MLPPAVALSHFVAPVARRSRALQEMAQETYDESFFDAFSANRHAFAGDDRSTTIPVPR